MRRRGHSLVLTFTAALTLVFHLELLASADLGQLSPPLELHRAIAAGVIPNAKCCSASPRLTTGSLSRRRT